MMLADLDSSRFDGTWSRNKWLRRGPVASAPGRWATSITRFLDYGFTRCRKTVEELSGLSSKPFVAAGRFLPTVLVGGADRALFEEFAPTNLAATGLIFSSRRFPRSTVQGAALRTTED